MLGKAGDGGNATVVSLARRQQGGRESRPPAETDNSP